MWLFTQRGFYSVVEDRQSPGCLLVRSRHKADLVNFISVISADAQPSQTTIREPPSADYPYRLSIPREIVAGAVSKLAAEIDYGNFKDRVHDTPGQSNKNRAYMKIWGAMREAQSDTVK